MNLFEYFYDLASVKKIINSDKIKLSDSCDSYNQMLIATDFLFNNKSLVIVLPNIYLAQKYYDELSNIVNENDVLFFPADELVSAEMVSSTGDFLFERIQTIYTAISGSKKIIITNLHGAIKYEMNPTIWKNSIFKLNKGLVIEPNELCNNLVKIGYEATSTTVKTGQFSKRGSIVDIFPLGYTDPIRLDFFGEEIDTIKEYDIESQRSHKMVDNIVILPVIELIYDENDFKNAKNKILSFIDKFKLSEIEESIYKKDIYLLSEHKSLDTLSKYTYFFDNTKSTILDFIDNKKIYIIDSYKCKELSERLVLDLNDYCSRIGGYSISNIPLFKQFDLVSADADVIIEGLRGINLDTISVFAKDIIPYKANQKQILQDMKDLMHRKNLIVAIKNEERYKRFEEFMDENGIRINPIDDLSRVSFGYINCIREIYPSFELQNESYILINESDLFDIEYKQKKAKYKSIYKNAIKISKYDELCIGDYVVHYDYGIGKYLGIQTLNMNGIKRDFIYVMYANESALYIPLEKISDLMKYASKDVEGVVLHEIGGTSWAKTKARVKKRVHDISDKLIAIYSERQKANGFAFPVDDADQLLFEDDFEYELTPDQKRAVEEIKKDMESKRPMDRLICGDVGYGKTEVALRAAFKAVYGGKQVCVLTPTTILARQHYLTFKKRMDKYGIRVELLSRFVPKKIQTQVLDGLSKGSVDVVVGTHRVLSNEVKFKDLGLLIIDEEQRFGVTHKERIKELKVNVDCITLSATPIPRTLQMSVMGLKDLSMIETPPKNRYPIQTYVIERNDHIIADAIEREMARGGQVFYLYNWTESIEDEAVKLKQLVPDARICIGHGKLSKDQLESVISDFIDKKYDVLLCTTIIETGIDMPDTNTLIIHDADRLGLSQMYQIRGRVGRSNKIAYAYLMYEPRKILTPEAEKRLETIKEFNELGSGFKIAMRDLSIRGAGDLLGEEQSGFVESVGIDMYLKILDEEINKNDPHKNNEVTFTPLSNRTINQNYIDNDDIRISIHKKIDGLNSLKELDDLIMELTDRFGLVDDDLKTYMYEKLMNRYCKRLGIYKIDTSDKKFIKFRFTKEASKLQDGNKLFQLAYKVNYIILKYIDFEISISFNIISKNKLTYFKEICEYFDQIVMEEKKNDKN
ncbi:MAG: transcription-repair coupling factor [Anaeroplasma sp.]